MQYPDKETAIKTLEEAEKLNPGDWKQHCEFVALALPTGFCLLEKRFVDVACRYGIHEYTVSRWKKTIEIKEYFEKKMKCSIYDVLPNVKENTFV